MHTNTKVNKITTRSSSTEEIPSVSQRACPETSTMVAKLCFNIIQISKVICPFHMHPFIESGGGGNNNMIYPLKGTHFIRGNSKVTILIKRLSKNSSLLISPKPKTGITLVGTCKTHQFISTNVQKRPEQFQNKCTIICNFVL